VRTQGIFCHQLIRYLTRELAGQTTADVNAGKLVVLGRAVLAQFLPLAFEVSVFGIGLRTYRHVFACGHGHRTGDQTGDARDQDLVPRRRGRRHADNQAGGRHDAIVGSQHGGSQPANAGNQMILRVCPQAAHRFLPCNEYVW